MPDNPLAPPDSIRKAKLKCNEIEDRHACGQGRRVNPGVGKGLSMNNVYTLLQACGPQPGGARRRAGICFVAAPRRCTPTSPASRRLASARPALAPKCKRYSLTDPYLDHNKIVLASVKYAGQKIHLGDGVYTDFIARYREGRYQPFEWTFPDFRDGRYDVDLISLDKISCFGKHRR
jgi:hypothetical protein